jgi:uncharacterized membrane protein
MTRRYDLLPKHRLEAFSDGVLAIVITLLVLEIKVPTETDDLAHALLSEWRTYLGYIVSFAFVGGWWIAHSNLTRFMRAGTGRFFRLNLLALLFVSFSPFTTSLMAANGHHEGARLATIVFGINLLLASLMLNALGWYLAREKDIVDDEVAEADLRGFVRGRWWATGLLAVAVVAALLEPVAAVGLYLASTILFIVEPLIPRGQRTSAASGEAGGGEGPPA